jgi:hypothetical protein
MDADLILGALAVGFVAALLGLWNRFVCWWVTR